MVKDFKFLGKELVGGDHALEGVGVGFIAVGAEDGGEDGAPGGVDDAPVNGKTGEDVEGGGGLAGAEVAEGERNAVGEHGGELLDELAGGVNLGAGGNADEKAGVEEVIGDEGV